MFCITNYFRNKFYATNNLLLYIMATNIEITSTFSQSLRNEFLVSISLPGNFLCMLPHSHLFPKSQVFGLETVRLLRCLLLLSTEETTEIG